MANIVTVSAPGKVILLGEHAVVYDRPCIVTAIGQRMRIVAERLEEPFFELEAKDVGVKRYRKPIVDLKRENTAKEAKFVEAAANNFIEKYKIAGGIRLKLISEISPKVGLGSSSAAVVCVVKSLAELFSIKISNKEMFNLSYKTVLDVQQKGSGFDVAAAIWGKTLYFVTGGKKIEPVSDSLPLVVGYSGFKADTLTMIKQVSEMAEGYPKIIADIYDQISKIVELGRAALRKKDWKALGELMNFNQGYLKSLGVSTKKLDDMVNAALGAGAWGAKLSGAGGGDCMIALVASDKKQRVEGAIKEEGGEIIKVSTDAPGVRLD